MPNDAELSIQKMSLEKLSQYRKMIGTTNMYVNFAGIGLLLFTLFFHSWIIIVPSTLLVIILAHISQSIDNIITLMDNRIQALLDK